MDFERGSTFTCPTYESPGAKPHDTREKTWRHLNFFSINATLQLEYPGVDCGKGCGVYLVDVPWARLDSSFTMPIRGLRYGAGSRDACTRYSCTSE